MARKTKAELEAELASTHKAFDKYKVATDTIERSLRGQLMARDRNVEALQTRLEKTERELALADESCETRGRMLEAITGDRDSFRKKYSEMSDAVAKFRLKLSNTESNAEEWKRLYHSEVHERKELQLLTNELRDLVKFALVRGSVDGEGVE